MDNLNKIIDYNYHDGVTDGNPEDVLELAECFKSAMYGDGIVMTSTKNEDSDFASSKFGKLRVKDLLTRKDLLPLFPEAITHVMLDEIEPRAVVYDTLFNEVGVTRSGTFVIHNIGPLSAGPVADNGEYPETNFALDRLGYRININTMKFGLQINISDDVFEDNLIGVVGLWLRRAANALVRNREKMSMDKISKFGIITFDNSNPSGYSWDVKSYTGRAIDGSYNGTLSLNDLMEMYVSALLEGFTLDTLLMHPLAWQTFMTDPEMKEIVLQNNTVVSYVPPRGSRARGWTTLTNGGLGLSWDKGTGSSNIFDPSTMKLGANPWTRNLNALGATFNIPPRYFPTPLTIVVTPYSPFGQVTVGSIQKYWTDLVFAQRDECGLVMRKQEPITETFDDREKEIRKIRMKEVFGMGIMNQGKAIRVAKRVVIDRNYVFQNYNAATLSEINRKSGLSGATYS